jgi:hypothetical protein
MDDSEPLLENLNDGPKNEYIDKLTMELLLNKNHYSKYLEKTDPKKHDQYQEYKSKLRKYSVEIIDITSQLIENPKSAPSLDIDDSFNTYVKSILRHFELKELENPQNKSNEDEDMLFGEMNTEPVEPKPSRSFWGKERVVKKSSGLSADARAFSRGNF